VKADMTDARPSICIVDHELKGQERVVPRTTRIAPTRSAARVVEPTERVSPTRAAGLALDDAHRP
jgi:hypothetical protein